MHIPSGPDIGSAGLGIIVFVMFMVTRAIKAFKGN
jgi:hypothetical protein